MDRETIKRAVKEGVREGTERAAKELMQSKSAEERQRGLRLLPSDAEIEVDVDDLVASIRSIPKMLFPNHPKAA